MNRIKVVTVSKGIDGRTRVAFYTKNQSNLVYKSIYRDPSVTNFRRLLRVMNKRMRIELIPHNEIFGRSFYARGSRE